MLVKACYTVVKNLKQLECATVEVLYNYSVYRNHSYALKKQLSIHISFSIAAITNHHKFSGLSNTNLLFCSSVCQKADLGHTGLTMRCMQGYIPFWRF